MAATAVSRSMAGPTAMFPGAMAYLRMNKPRNIFEIMIHTNIDHIYTGAGMFGYDVDGRAPSQEIEYHLVGHVFGICADSVLHDSMVRSKNDHGFLSNPGPHVPPA